MEITRKLDKKSLMYFYTIYTTITSSILNYRYCSQVYYIVTTRQIYCSYTFNIIVLVSSTMFQTYDITLCNASCDHSYIPLHCLRNKRNRKEKKQKSN